MLKFTPITPQTVPPRTNKPKIELDVNFCSVQTPKQRNQINNLVGGFWNKRSRTKDPEKIEQYDSTKRSKRRAKIGIDCIKFHQQYQNSHLDLMNRIQLHKFKRQKNGKTMTRKAKTKPHYSLLLSTLPEIIAQNHVQAS